MYYVDSSLELPKVKIWVAKPNKQIIGRLKEAKGVKLNVNFGDINDISFELPYYIAKQIDGDYQFIKNPNIDKVKDRYLLKVKFNDITEWFVINKLNKQSDDDKESLPVSAYSLQHMLNGVLIRDYNVVSYSPSEVLSDILTETNWTIGTIDDAIVDKKREFDISEETVYSVVKDVASTFEVVPIFDTEKETISLIKLENVSKFEGLKLSYGKYIKSLSKESDADEMVTRFYPYGKDGLGINAVNPTGSSYIESFDYFIYPFQRDENRNVIQHSEYMSDELCHAILDYEALIDSKNGEFQSLLTQQSQLQLDLLTLQSDLSTLNTNYLIAQDNADLLKTSQDYVLLNKTLNNESTSIDLVTKQNSYYCIFLFTNDSTKTKFNLNNTDMTMVQSNIWSVFKRWYTDTPETLHCSVATTGTNQTAVIEMVKVSSDDYSNLTDDQLFAKYSVGYTSDQVNQKNNDITNKNAEITDNNTQITNLKNELSIENNFSPELISERKQYIIERTWTEENHIDENELYTDAVNKFIELKQPKTVFNLSIINFLGVLEESRNWDKLVIGSKILIHHERLEEKIEATLTNIQYDFDNDSVGITIANTTNLLSDDEKLAQIISDTHSATTSLNMQKSDWSTKDELDEVSQLVNSEWDAAKKRITAGVNESVEIGQRGIIIKNPNFPDEMLVAQAGVLALSKDKGNTWKTAISPDGVVAERLIGQVIAGEDLSITNSNVSFTLDDNGARFDVGSFIVSSTSGSNLVDDWQSSSDFINSFTNDSLITSYEKDRISEEWNKIATEYISETATIDGYYTSIEQSSLQFVTDYKNAYTSLYNYLNVDLQSDGKALLDPTNLNATSSVDATTYKSKFDDYYNSKAEVDKQLLLKAQSNIDDVQGNVDQMNDDIDGINITLGNMANDSILDYNERQKVKDDLTDIIGFVISDSTTTLPTTSALDSGAKGSFYTARQSALNAGLTTSDTNYTNLATQYNNLKNYLEGLAPIDAWDISTANQSNTITVDKATWRDKWLQYYLAEQSLDTATAQKLKSNVDNVQIGGRNLAIDSNFDNGSANGWSDIYGTQTVSNSIYSKTFTSLNSSARIENVFSNLKSGTYTLSIYAKIPQNIEWVGFVNATIVSYTDVTADTSNYKVYSVTFNVTSDGNVTVRGYFRNVPIGSVFYMDWYKLEKGNKATDWTPAPEDMETRVTAVEQKITDTAIISTVTESQTYIDDLSGKVSTDSVISSINQTAESIKISGSKLDITGSVTFASFDSATKYALSNDGKTINLNPYFIDWTGTYPNGYPNGTIGTGSSFSKISDSSRKGNILQYVVASGINTYLNPTAATNLPYYQYVTVECSFRLDSGTIDGAGILFRVEASTDIDNVINFKSLVSSPTTSKWYRVTKTLKLSSATAPTGFAGYSVFHMGGYTGIGTISAKTISFGEVIVRPSTDVEIGSYETTLTVNANSSNWSDAYTTANAWKGTAVNGVTQINGGLIQTNTILAQSMILSDFTNLVENPDFETDTIGQVPKGWTSGTIVDVSGLSNPVGTKALSLNASSTINVDAYCNNVIPVTPGQAFRVAFDYRTLNTAGGGSIRFGFRRYNASKAPLSTWDTVATTTTKNTSTWTTLGGTYTVPSGCYYIQPWLSFSNNGETTNKAYFKNLRINRAMNGELIVDGQVTASKLNVKGLTVNNGTVNTLVIDSNGNLTTQGKHISTGSSGTMTIDDGSITHHWESPDFPDGSFYNDFTLDYNGFSLIGQAGGNGADIAKISPNELAVQSSSSNLFSWKNGKLTLSPDNGVTHFYTFTPGTDNILRFDNGDFGIVGTHALLFSTYSGGWYMSDSTWIRAKNDKGIFTNGDLDIGGVINVGTKSALKGLSDGAYIYSAYGTYNRYLKVKDDGSVSIVVDGTAKHFFYADGTKSAGTIEVDGVTLGMSPIESPQIILEYTEWNIPLTSEGTKVYIDSTFLKTVSSFDIWASRNNALITEVGEDYFIISGSGTCSATIRGTRIGHEDVFYDLMETEGN